MDNQTTEIEELFNADLIPNMDGKLPIGMKLRPLQIDDYENGFLELLSQLTTVGEISRDEFIDQFKRMKDSKNYYIIVIEDVEVHRIIAAATLVTEHKFIHTLGLRGRVEDVVVDELMRGQKFGALLNEVLKDIAEKLGVYKLSLECKDELCTFYGKFGYKKDVNFMCQRF